MPGSIREALLFVLSWSVFFVSYSGAQQGGPLLSNRTQYIDLLRRPGVANELLLTDFHKKELEKLSMERSRVLGTAMRQIGTEESPEKRGVAYAAMQEQLEKLERAAYGMLLPFQQQRMDQISNQAFLRAIGPGGGLTHPKMAEILDMPEAQIKSVRERTEVVNAKLQKKLESLNRQAKQAKLEARSEVLSLLNDEQRSAYEDLLGEIVDLNEPKQIVVKRPASSAK